METPSREDIESTCLSHQQGGMSRVRTWITARRRAAPHAGKAWGGETCILVKRAHSTSRPNDWLR